MKQLKFNSIRIGDLFDDIYGRRFIVEKSVYGGYLLTDIANFDFTLIVPAFELFLGEMWIKEEV